MPVLNDRALRPLYRKAGRALGQLNQRIDRWTRRYPTTTAVLFALLGWVLLCWLIGARYAHRNRTRRIGAGNARRILNRASNGYRRLSGQTLRIQSFDRFLEQAWNRLFF